MEQLPSITEQLENLDTHALLSHVQRMMSKLAIDKEYPKLNIIAGEAAEIVEIVRGRVGEIR